MALNSKLKEKLGTIESRYEELGMLLTKPETLANPNLLRKYGQEQSRLGKIVSLYRQVRQLDDELDGARFILAGSDDPELSLLFPVLLSTRSPSAAPTTTELVGTHTSGARRSRCRCRTCGR